MKESDIPKSISPCNLVDAFIEFQFETNYNSNWLLYNVLQSIDPDTKIFLKIPYVDTEGNNTSDFFYTDRQIRFFIINNRIDFNIVTEYPGWDAYFSKIVAILDILSKFVEFKDIRMNYISKWPLSILDNIDGEVCFKQFKKRFQGTEVNFKAERRSEDGLYVTKATVSLKDLITIDSEVCSIVDLNLTLRIPQLSETSNFDTAVISLLSIHDDEKNMFFRLLSEDFVKRLNPIK